MFLEFVLGFARFSCAGKRNVTAVACVLGAGFNPVNDLRCRNSCMLASLRLSSFTGILFYLSIVVVFISPNVLWRSVQTRPSEKGFVRQVYWVVVTVSQRCC